MSWFTESNRNKHFFYAIPAGFIGTILFVLGLAIGMEFKDKQYGNKFDELDILMTLAGGVIGQFLAVAFYVLMYKYVI